MYIFDNQKNNYLKKAAKKQLSIYIFLSIT